MLLSKRVSPISAGLAALVVGLASLSMTASPEAQQNRPLDRALRISGTYENGRVVSAEVIPLEVRLPLTVKERVLADAAPAEGYFVEILDKEAKALQRLRIDDPSFVLMEYEDPQEPGRIVSKELKADRGTFSILVPALEKSHALRFMQVAPAQAGLPAEKRLREEVGTFILPDSGSGPAVPVSKGGAQ